MKTRHQLLALGVVASAGLSLYGHRSAPDEVSEPVARGAVHATDDGPHGAPPPAPQPISGDVSHSPVVVTIAALRPRAELMARPASELFVSQTFDAPPPAPSPAPAAPPPAPPTAPPLPFAYLGKKFDNGHWEVYLANGDHTYFLREGSVVESDYAVNAIRPPTLTLTYLPLKQMQTLSIGAAD